MLNGSPVWRHPCSHYQSDFVALYKDDQCNNFLFRNNLPSLLLKKTALSNHSRKAFVNVPGLSFSVSLPEYAHPLEFIYSI